MRFHRRLRVHDQNLNPNNFVKTWIKVTYPKRASETDSKETLRNTFSRTPSETHLHKKYQKKESNSVISVCGSNNSKRFFPLSQGIHHKRNWIRRRIVKTENNKNEPVLPPGSKLIIGSSCNVRNWNWILMEEASCSDCFPTNNHKAQGLATATP